MALQLRVTGETLRITGDAAGARGAVPPPGPAEVFLATEAGEPVLTDAGETIAVEASHA